LRPSVLHFVCCSARFEEPDAPNFCVDAVLQPWGKPSSPLSVFTLPPLESSPNEPGPEVVFISRHGVDHSILPSEVNNRANIAALKSLGVEAVVAFSAVGSLREEIAPGK
jgi:5'-methylthioadenosine phosphorylase